MPKTHNIASFVLRFTQEIWQDLQGEPHVRWRGHIRHVQGNEEERFTDFAEAVTFMQHYLTQLTVETLSGDNEEMSQEKIIEESFNLWEQFASSYAQMMAQAMKHSIRRSEALKEQVDEASKKVWQAWQFPYVSPPLNGQDDELLQTLQALNDQVKTLSTKIDALEQKLEQQNR